MILNQTLNRALHQVMLPVLTGTLLASSLVSCSVKENRGPCPCYLDVTVDASATEDGDCIVSVFTIGGGDLTLRDTLSSDAPALELSLKKGHYSANALWGLSQCTLTDSLVVIPVGCECDSLYSSITPDVDATGETANINFARNKQFATLNLSFETEGEFPFGVALRGNVDGYDLRTLAPHAGEFFVAPESLNETNSLFRTRLPRQKDNSLVIVLQERTQTASTKVAVTDPNIIPLGEIIARTQYDWSAESLEDIDIRIDYVRAQITIHVCDWEAVITMSFEI